MNRDQLREALEYAEPGEYAFDKADGAALTAVFDAARLLLGGPLSDILELRGEEVTKDWLCVEVREDGEVGYSNLPGGPDHCYFTGKKHLGTCGPRLLIQLPAEVKQGTTEGEER